MHNLSGRSSAKLGTFSGLVTLADAVNLPEGGSPRNQNVDFTIGTVATRTGLSNPFTYENAAVGPSPGNEATDVPVSGGAAWSSPGNVLLNTGVYASTAITPSQSSDAIYVQEFGFSVPSVAVPQGFTVTLTGYATASTTLSVQMLKAGSPVGVQRTVELPIGFPGTVTVGSASDLFGASWVSSDLNNTQFGIALTVSSLTSANVNLGYTTLTATFIPLNENMNYVTTFEDNFGTIRTVALDNTGQFFVENVSSNPGVFEPLFSGPPAGSFASSFTADSRQYFAISDLQQGNYPPQQYTGSWNDRVSQVGPGAAPTFTGIGSSTDEFDISTITQPTAQSRGSSYFLQSTGPGSTTAGNVVTVYYSDSTLAGPDTDLVNAFNSGQPVYIYTSFVPGDTGGGVTQGPYTVQVTAVGEGQPPSQPRSFYYFTYDVSSIVYTYYRGSDGAANVSHYQRTLATMTMNEAVPGLTVGNSVTISGASVSGYNATWTITQALNSGSYTITSTSVASGVATYNYSLISGTAPAAGELVTVTGTNNANGALNVTNAPIASASGGSSGTFTINVSTGDFASASEEGQATTAGTVFTFDPGPMDVGNPSDNPIFGDSTGGTLTFQSGNSQLVAAGARQGTVFFITRNGYYTAPAPPVTFSLAGEISAIQASNIPIGPPNVIARAIAFTEAGANGVPGANFYTIPDPVTYVVDNTTYTTSSLFINDNTTTTATFFFTDAVLLNAEEIDIQGNDLFNLGELGDAAWCAQYAGRTVWGRVRNKIQNFLNLSFDGGYLANPGGNLFPLGWQNGNNAGTQTLLVSPVFGNSYYVSNTTGSTLGQAGLIYQSAYQDYENVAILQNQTAYSVRITVRTPASAASGNIVLQLVEHSNSTGFGSVFGQFTLPISSISSTMATYTGTLLTTSTLNIPSSLNLAFFVENLPNGGDVEVDRIEIYPTIQPTNLTQLSMSYQNDPESFDLVTGGIDTTTTNAQPANGGFTLHDEFYIVKESSLGYISDSPNQEPANWNPYKEVSNVAGASGINAYDVGEEWAIMACRNGLFLFNGGAPVPIQLEIPDIWDAINWAYGYTICVRNDVLNRRIYCAIPLPTPNPWMVTTEVNSNPTVPNVVLMLNYKGIGDVGELMQAQSMHLTTTGNLAVRDFRRKWSLWTIPTPYIGLIKRNELLSLMMFCNGIQSSKIYTLGAPNTGQDDGAYFTSSYCTYGFVDEEQEEGNAMFGQHNKRYVGYDSLISGTGTAQVTFFQNILEAPYPFTTPGGITLSNPAANDIENPLDEYAQRIFCEFQMDQGWFDLSELTLWGAKDTWAPLRGR